MHLDQFVRTAFASAALLGAIAAPAASARGAPGSLVVRSNPDEQAAQPKSVAAAPPTTASLVRPNPDEQAAQLARAVATPGQTASVVRPNPDQQTRLRAPATIVRVTSPHGFDWGDAGIGVAAGIALSILALGLVLLVSQRGSSRSRGPAPIAN